MRFWDSSALVPLLVAESSSRRIGALMRGDPVMLVWWGTPVECASALARRERDGSLGPAEAAGATARLRRLARAWNEVLPTEAVRRHAERVLRLHELRATDALQLAAAMVAAGTEPETLDVVCLDERLALAARREGFTVRP